MTGMHNYWLVLLSIIVATMASFVALVLAIRVAPSQQPQRQWISLAVGVLAIGSGIWTMHFIVCSRSPRATMWSRRSGLWSQASASLGTALRTR